MSVIFLCYMFDVEFHYILIIQCEGRICYYKVLIHNLKKENVKYGNNLNAFQLLNITFSNEV